jgi:hypothetical protein
MGALGPGVRARAAALLLRRALERGLDDFWRGVAPDMTRNGRHRILCLEAYIDRATARRLYLTWAALSTACHHRVHELPPSPTDVHDRLSAVTELLNALGRGPAVGDGAPGSPRSLRS